MDTAVSIRVFEWRGDLHLAIDRIGGTPDRRYAHRDRMASFSIQCPEDVLEEEVISWAIAQLEVWERAGLPHGHAVAPAPPEGGHRGEGETACRSVTRPLFLATLQEARPPA